MYSVATLESNTPKSNYEEYNGSGGGSGGGGGGGAGVDGGIGGGRI